MSTAESRTGSGRILIDLFTSLDGVAQADAGSACSTNGVLHDEVLAAFAR